MTEDTEDRFAFGANWQSFLTSLDEDRIEQAVQSLQSSLEVDSLVGKRFLDLGCGSGLFSLAAKRLGADVVSIDYDFQSVACTRALKEKFDDSSTWEIRQGSVLDQDLMRSLGDADVVYSWGVLHHTGQMEQAILNVSQRTKPGGKLFIAIYNDQGGASRRWLKIKQIYHQFPTPLRSCWVLLVAGCYEFKFALARLLRGRNPLPFADWKAKKADRGMSAWHDWVDWIGGLPFEVATPERIIVPLRKSGFVLENLRTVGNGWGCNEFVFRRREI